MKWVSCTAATSTLRFERSPSKQARLLGSLSPLVFNMARFRAIKPTYFTHWRLRHGNPLRVRTLTACLRDSVPSSDVTQPSLDTPTTSRGTPTLGPRKMMGEHNKDPLHFRQPYVCPTGLLNKTPHALRAAPSRAKGAPLNKYGFEMFFFQLFGSPEVASVPCGV